MRARVARRSRRPTEATLTAQPLRRAGTIFAVYEKTTPGLGTTADILRTGNDIVAAGYCMYGAATELVICFKGSGVERFALDPSLGEFIHTHTNVRTLTRTEPPP